MSTRIYVDESKRHDYLLVGAVVDVARVPEIRASCGNCCCRASADCTS